jgi:CheY-like chemotaxis protein
MILVVDDDPVIRLLVEEYLTALGYEVCAVATRASFNQTLATKEPVLCLIDMQLDGATGIDLLRDLRERPFTRKIPVIFLSASPEVGALMDAAGIHADAVVQKPFEPRMLAAEVARLIDMNSQSG